MPSNSKGFLRSWWVIYKEKKEIIIISSILFICVCLHFPLKLQKNGGPSDLVALFIEDIMKLVTFNIMRNENRLVTLLYLVGRKIFRFLVPSWKAENAFAFSGLLLILGNYKKSFPVRVMLEGFLLAEMESVLQENNGKIRFRNNLDKLFSCMWK